MQENQSFFERLNQKLKESLTVKLFTITILILLLMIPLSMVQSLIRERQYRSTDVINEVSNSWSNSQIVNGPVLTIPYWSRETMTSEGKERLVDVKRYLQLMPETLNIDGDISPKKLHRGIYDVVVYESQLNYNGRFDLQALADEKIDPDKMLWEQAVINIGVSDMRGIGEVVLLKVDDVEVKFKSGLLHANLGQEGLHAPINIAADQIFDFQFAMKLKGSSRLEFVPLASVTEVKLNSAWKSPSFMGSFLPAERDSVNGFPASWKILDLNRPIPQVTKGESLRFNDYSFGVSLLVPAAQYQKSDRTAKYGALVISLIFLIIFFTQILHKLSVHPFQYILIGLALVIFYTLLLSISEFTTFNTAYLISASAVIGLVSIYLHGVIRHIKPTGIIFLLQTIIFGFIYVIIQLEDTALLIGSIGLFLALAIVMLVSRKVDWYHLRRKE